MHVSPTCGSALVIATLSCAVASCCLVSILTPLFTYDCGTIFGRSYPDAQFFSSKIRIIGTAPQALALNVSDTSANTVNFQRVFEMRYSDRPVALWPSVFSEQNVFLANFATSICCLAMSLATACSSIFLARANSAATTHRVSFFQGWSALLVSVALFVVATVVFASKAYDVDVGGHEICAVAVGSQRTADIGLILQIVGCILSFFSFATSLSLATFQCARVERWIYGYSRWDVHPYPKHDSDDVYDPTLAIQIASVTHQNGETPELLKHAKSRQAANLDTSRDQAWEFHNSLLQSGSLPDVYVFVILIAFMPKLIIVFFAVLLAMLPAIGVAACYSRTIQRPIARVETRRCCFRWVALPIISLLAVPPVALILASLLIDFAIFSLFGNLYVLLTWRFAKRNESRRALEPYSGGPSLFTHVIDLTVLMVGAVHRGGALTVARQIACSVVGAPWIKYWLIGNPHCFDLDERFTTSSTEAMADLEPKQIHSAYKNIVTRPSLDKFMFRDQPVVRQSEDETALGRWQIAHFPEPPIGRKYAIGMEPISMFGALCHVVHMAPGVADDPTEFVMSKSRLPVFRCVYWYNNPFYPATGFSETHVADKENTLNAPTWVVCGHNFLGQLSDGVRPDWDPNAVAVRVKAAWASNSFSRDLFSDLNATLPGVDIV